MIRIQLRNAFCHRLGRANFRRARFVGRRLNRQRQASTSSKRSMQTKFQRLAKGMGIVLRKEGKRRGSSTLNRCRLAGSACRPRSVKRPSQAYVTSRGCFVQSPKPGHGRLYVGNWANRGHRGTRLRSASHAQRFAPYRPCRKAHSGRYKSRRLSTCNPLHRPFGRAIMAKVLLRRFACCWSPYRFTSPGRRACRSTRPAPTCKSR